MRKPITSRRSVKSVSTLWHGYHHIIHIRHGRHLTERKFHYPLHCILGYSKIVARTALQALFLDLFLILLLKDYIIEQETMVACHIYFGYIVRSVYLRYHGSQISDSLSTTLHYFIRTSFVSHLVNDIMEDIDQRMLENFSVLILVIFCHCLIRYTKSTLTKGLQMLRTFLYLVKNVIIYSQILLFTLSIEFQFTIWKQ